MNEIEMYEWNGKKEQHSSMNEIIDRAILVKVLFINDFKRIF